MDISGHPVSFLMVQKELKLEGFIVICWFNGLPAAFKEMYQWIQEVHI